MAQCITNQWVSTAPQARLTVTIQSETATTVTLKWVFEYVAHGYAASTSRARAYWVDIDGVRVANSNFNINGIAGTATIASGTKVQSKANWNGYVGFACAFFFDLTWSGSYAGSLGASGNIPIPAKTSYYISYNANGGTGAPGSQTKWYGETLKLSSTKPTRTGYTFQGWSYSTSGSVAYQPGANYTDNAGCVLYAIWKANTYTVSYDANGGTGAPASQTKTYGVNLTLTTAKPTKTNYNFKGWGTSAGSTTVAYAPGATYSNNSAITLYAIWELAYTAPRITDMKLDRIDGHGNVADDGTSLSVYFKWATDKTVSSVKAEYRVSGESTFKSLMRFAASGTSGTVDYVITQLTFDPEVSYDILITVTDSVGSSTYLGSISPMTYVIDCLKGGHGLAIGKPASKEGFEIAMDTTFEKKIFDRFEKEICNGMAVYDPSGIDPNTTMERLIVSNHANVPDSSYYWYVQTMFYGNKTADAARAQIAFPMNTLGSLVTRYFYNGAWSTWRRIVNEDEAFVKAMTVSAASGDATVTSGQAMLNLPTLSGNTAGSMLSQSGGGIKIGAGVDRVLVSAAAFVYASAVGNGYVWFGIHRVRGSAFAEQAVGLSVTNSGVGYTSVSIPPRIVDVQEGDIIKLRKYNTESFTLRGGASTYLTVEVARYAGRYS